MYLINCVLTLSIYLFTQKIVCSLPGDFSATAKIAFLLSVEMTMGWVAPHISITLSTYDARATPAPMAFAIEQLTI